MQKAVKIGFMVIVVISGLLVILNFGLGMMVKTAVTNGGPLLLGVPVTLEKADFRLLQGIIRLRGFTLGNPEGFKTEHAIKVDEVAVDFDMPSLFRDTFVIRRIRVKAPEIVYELGLGNSNIGRILEKVESGEAKPEAEPASGQKKVIIEDFLIEGARVRLSATLAMGAAAPIPLPDIHLKDIGKEKQGASPAEVVRKVFGAIAGSVTGVASGAVNLAADGAKAVGAGAGKVVEGVKGLIGLGAPEAATNMPAAAPAAAGP